MSGDVRKCAVCEVKYDVSVAKRAFGDMLWVSECCSPKCYTERMLSRKPGEGATVKVDLQKAMTKGDMIDMKEFCTHIHEAAKLLERAVALIDHANAEIKGISDVEAVYEDAYNIGERISSDMVELWKLEDKAKEIKHEG